MGGRLRTFFALEIGGPALAEAARSLEALRHTPAGNALRFVRPEGLHVTLRFVGAIDREAVAPLAAAVGLEVSAWSPFPLQLGALGLFPSARRPRVVSLGIEPEAPLAGLAAAVERGVVAAGFAPESRSFRPHLTLARVREGCRIDPAVLATKIEPLRFAARGVVLFASRPDEGGSVYTALERLELRGPVSQTT
ncbi:RNA 2',3'-cyclic phosphodiesterase [Myxococcaceae bacterium]|nr:RNA 2',3'-cyclic phosphodiesterase [Myxococcaceae bacterium]